MDYLPLENVRKIGPDLDISQIHVARAETDWSHAYIQAQNDFGAARWFPIFPTTQITGYVYKWRKDTYFRRWAGRWQPGTAPNTARMALDDKLYYQLDWRAVQYPIPSHLEGIADPAINIEDATNRLLTNTLLIEREKEIGDAFFKTGVWSYDFTGVATPGEVDPTAKTFLQFDQPGSKPRDLFAQLKVFLDRQAMKPNVAVMASPVFEKLRVHPQLLQWFAAYQVPGMPVSEINEAAVAQALGLEKIVVSNAKYTTSAEGVAVDNIVLDYIFDSRGMWLGHVDTPGLLSANSGMLISQNFDQSVPGGVDLAIERVPDLITHVEYMQGFMSYQPVMVGKDLGIFLDHAISAEAAAGTA
jgi:hypothetical protein